MSKTTGASRAFVTIVAVIAWLGILLQLWVSAQRSLEAGHTALAGVLLALCYNTVLSNILVALVSSRLALGGASNRLTGSGMLAATAVYIFVVGLIYSLLLRSQWAPVGVHKLADALLHDVTPILYVLWWLFCAPKGGLKWGAPLKWLIYPLVYFAASLVAGIRTGHYLYPFGDLSVQGLATVLRNGALILLLYLILGTAAVAVARLASGSTAR